MGNIFCFNKIARQCLFTFFSVYGKYVRHFQKGYENTQAKSITSYVDKYLWTRTYVTQTYYAKYLLFFFNPKHVLRCRSLIEAGRVNSGGRRTYTKVIGLRNRNARVCWLLNPFWRRRQIYFFVFYWFHIRDRIKCLLKLYSQCFS